MAKIDDYTITVETESPSYDVELPQQPVEEGIDLIDHVQRKARGLSLSGWIVGDDADKVRKYILNCMEMGAKVTYLGRTTFSGLIGSFATSHAVDIGNGFSFTMELKESRIAKSSYVGKLPAPIKAQAAPVASSGIKQKTKSKAQAKAKTNANPWELS